MHSLLFFSAIMSIHMQWS